jgi:hypothetical protein
MRWLSIHSGSQVRDEKGRLQRQLLVLASALALGCNGLAGSGTGPQVNSVSQSLLGNVVVNDCAAPVQSFFQTSMTVSRLVTQTPEFQNCIRNNYRPCSGDDDKNVEDLVAITRSANDMKLACADLSDGTNGSTSYWSEHDYGFSGKETFDVSTSFATNLLTSFNAGQGTDNFYAPFRLASVIYHETMHVHGYSHGDNNDAGAAAKSCGYGDDPTWFWRRNAAPYAVEFCMLGAYTQAGNYGANNAGSANGDLDNAQYVVATASAPPAPIIGSIVELYMQRANKYPTAHRRRRIFDGIVDGSIATLAQLEQAAKANSIPSQITDEETFIAGDNKEHFDILLNPQDQAYYRLTVKSDDRIELTVSYPASSIAPLWGVSDLAGNWVSPQLAGTTLPVAGGRAAYRIQQDLKAGDYLLHVTPNDPAQSAAISIGILAKSAPLPPPPTGCKGDMGCAGQASIGCDNSHEIAWLQVQNADLSWTTVDEDTEADRKISILLEDSTTYPVTAQGQKTFRVCSKSANPTPNCGSPIAVDLAHSACAWPGDHHQIDCTNKANWVCNTVPGGGQSCHCGPYVKNVKSPPLGN